MVWGGDQYILTKIFIECKENLEPFKKFGGPGPQKFQHSITPVCNYVVRDDGSFHVAASSFSFLNCFIDMLHIFLFFNWQQSTFRTYDLDSGLYVIELGSLIRIHCINVGSLQMSLNSLTFSVQALCRIIWDAYVFCIRNLQFLMVTLDIFSVFLSRWRMGRSFFSQILLVSSKSYQLCWWDPPQFIDYSTTIISLSCLILSGCWYFLCFVLNQV